MLEETLYFLTKSDLSIQISKYTEADLRPMQHLGCNTCDCGNS